MTNSTAIEIRPPTLADGARIWQLVHECDVLDQNSCYAYLLLCRDFAATCRLALDDGRLLGFVLAYIPPPRPEALFVWQIGTARAARGQGIARSLLHALLRDANAHATHYLEATVTPSNQASARLFRGLAQDLNSPFRIMSGFQSKDFDPNHNGSLPHEREDFIRIGPFEVKHENI